MGKNKRAFTLLEMVIVISIMLTLTLVHTISKNDDGIILQNTANEIVSAIRFARRQYEAGDATVKFRISKIDGKFYYTVIENAHVQTIHNPIPTSIVVSRRTAEDNQLGDENTGFVPAGNMITEVKFSGETSSGISLRLESKSVKKSYIVTVIPISSRIHLYEIE